jgi:hypothetical protein
MTTQPLSQSVDRTSPILDARTIAPLGHVEAGILARVELEDFLQLLESLGPEEWERLTMCPAWSVRDILAHQAGAYRAGASFAELRHQFSQKVPPGCESRVRYQFGPLLPPQAPGGVTGWRSRSHSIELQHVASVVSPLHGPIRCKICLQVPLAILPEAS